MQVDSIELEKAGLVSKDDVRALSALIMTMAQQIKRDEDQHGAGMTLSEARKQATEEIGSKMVPPVSGKELESMLAKARSALYRDRRLAGIKAAYAKKREAKAEELKQRLLDAEKLRKTTLPEKPSMITRHADGRMETFDAPVIREVRHEEPKEKKARVVDLYRAWVQNNDTIPLDVELAFFNGKTPEAFSFARSLLKKEGYQFLRRDGRWFVTVRPEEKKYTEKEVQAMIEKVMRDNRLMY